MNKGTYCLIIFLDRTREIDIGRRGTAIFPEGYYCYVGSALNNLQKRIDRHYLKNKPLRWHIDYLLEEAVLLEVKTIVSGRRLECRLSREIAAYADGCIMKGFGSSDCACTTHLHFFNENPRKIVEKTIGKVIDNENNLS